MPESTSKQIEKIDKRLEQLKAQKRAIQAREREAERKKRTRRLVQNGALAEKYLQSPDMAPEDFEKLLSKIAELPAVKEILKKK